MCGFLPNTTTVEAAGTARRIKDKMEECPAGPTISIGTSSITEHAAIEDLIRAADRAMYRVTNMRHQAVVVHTSGESTPL